MGLLFDIYIVFMGLVSAGLISMSLRRRRIERQISDDAYNSKTLVMVPCKGFDLTFEQNLRSLKAQDYKNYDIVAIVDNAKDVSLQKIRKLGIKQIVADKKFRHGSGKVNAIASALGRMKNYDVYVIVDSDVFARKDWLRNLVIPLDDRRIGISTTYPQFRAMGGFWSCVKSVWGAVGFGLMESERTRFGWGGSLAFRKDLMSKKQFEYFSKAVSDDIALTRICKANRLDIFYSRDAEPVVNTDDNLHAFVEWANRQTALSISGNRKVFYAGVIYYFMHILLFVSAIIMSLLYSPIFLLLFAPLAIHAAKDYKRIEYRKPIMLAIEIFMPFLFFFNLLAARGTKSITWRGRNYSLKSTDMEAPTR